jgi:hypothetical protein
MMTDREIEASAQAAEERIADVMAIILWGAIAGVCLIYVPLALWLVS